MTVDSLNGRYVLTARKGKVVTNGEIYGRKIFLAVGLDCSDFYEVDESEEPNGELE